MSGYISPVITAALPIIAWRNRSFAWRLSGRPVLRYHEAKGRNYHAIRLVRPEVFLYIGAGPDEKYPLDADGVLSCNTRFGDYPINIPMEKWHPWEDAFAGWMLLSYGKTVTASNAMPEHPAGMAVDESIRSWWAAEDDDCQQWLQIDLESDLESDVELNAFQVKFIEEQ